MGINSAYKMIYPHLKVKIYCNFIIIMEYCETNLSSCLITYGSSCIGIPILAHDSTLKSNKSPMT